MPVFAEDQEGGSHPQMQFAEKFERQKCLGWRIISELTADLFA